MNRIYLITVLIGLFFNDSVLAQHVKVSLSGQVLEADKSSPLYMASVSVRNSSDSSLVTYGFSDEKGNFKTPPIESGKRYRLMIAFTGYEVIIKEFLLPPDAENHSLGIFSLKSTVKSLDEMVITAERPPIILRNDTLEFNASAFQTLPNALVEDLLKKLPGVQVSEDGTLTYNGKKVNKLLIDGKEFFGSDPKIAMQNLPAQVVDKVQVAEDKTERKFNPGMKESDIGQVINITLKKGMKKGYFGKLYGGAGLDQDKNFRYEGGGIVNFFRDTFQISVLGFSNNVNKQAFSFDEMRNLAGLGRTGVRSVSMDESSGYNFNGIGVGGARSGISTSSGSGFNLNHIIGKGSINFLYFGGMTENQNIQKRVATQYLNDSIFTNLVESQTENKNSNHHVALGYRVTLDTLTRYSLRAELDLNNTSYNQVKNQSNATALREISKGLVLQNSKMTTPSYSLSGNLSRNSKKSESSFYMNFYMNGFQRSGDLFSKVFTRFPDASGDTLDQQRTSDNSRFTNEASIGYDWQINDKWGLETSSEITFNRNSDGFKTYYVSGEGVYNLLQNLLSNGASITDFRKSVDATLFTERGEFMIKGGMGLMHFDVNGVFDDARTPYQFQKFYWIPNAEISYENSSLEYSLQIENISSSQLNPAFTNLDGLVLRKGNDKLVPVEEHELTLYSWNYKQKKNRFLNTWNTLSFINNAITTAQWIDSNGVITTQPVQTSGARRLYVSGSFHQDFKQKANFQYRIGFSTNFNYQKNPVFVNDVKDYFSVYSGKATVSSSYSYKDLTEFSAFYTFGPALNKDGAGQNIFSYTQTGSVSGLIRWPKNIVFKTSVAYNSVQSPENAGQQDLSFVLLNAEVYYSFMKNEKATLSLMVYDILNQNSSYTSFSTANMVVVNQSNVLGRYVLLSLTYNLKDFKGNKPGSSKGNPYFWF